MNCKIELQSLKIIFEFVFLFCIFYFAKLNCNYNYNCNCNIILHNYLKQEYKYFFKIVTELWSITAFVKRCGHVNAYTKRQSGNIDARIPTDAIAAVWYP